MRHSFDAGGNQLSETDARGNTERFEYDAENRLYKRTDCPVRLSGTLSPLATSFFFDEAERNPPIELRQNALASYFSDAELPRFRATWRVQTSSFLRKRTLHS